MTTESRIQQLERELERLARRRRLPVVGIGFAFLLGACVILVGSNKNTAQSQPVAKPAKTVVANELILEDESGTKRIAMLVSKDGPVLMMTDEKGKPRVALFAAKGGPGLAINGENGQQRALLSATSIGTGLLISGENGKTRVALSETKNKGERGLALFDKDGNRRIAMDAEMNDGPGLLMTDAKSKTRAALAANDDEGWLRLSDNSSMPRIVLKATADTPLGGSGLTFYGKDMKALAEIGTKAGVSAVDLYDRLGTERLRIDVSDKGPEIWMGDDKLRGVWSAP